MDAADLSRPGCCLSLRDPGGGTVVAGGVIVPVTAISGVLVRRQAVYSQELPHVHEDDRAYVAAEMTALLAWWLHALAVPVFNRPSGAMLSGPGWRAEQWRHFAASRGIPAAAVDRSSAEPVSPPPAACAVVVFGGRALTDTPACLATAAVALAAAAALDLLQVWFDEAGAVLGADGFPPLTPALVTAIAERVGV